MRQSTGGDHGLGDLFRSECVSSRTRDGADPAEIVRRLNAHSARARERRPLARATACELDKAAVKNVVGATTPEAIYARATLRARSSEVSNDPALVQDVRRLIAAAPPLGNGVFDASGTAALGSWLGRAADSPARAWLLRMVQRCVAAHHGLAVVFDSHQTLGAGE